MHAHAHRRARAHTHAHTHALTHSRTHARTHTHTHTSNPCQIVNNGLAIFTDANDPFLSTRGHISACRFVSAPIRHGAVSTPVNAFVDGENKQREDPETTTRRRGRRISAVKAPDCQPRAPGFGFTCCRFKTSAI